MIIGRISDAHMYFGLSQRIARALQVASLLTSESPCGNTVIDGKNLYYNIWEIETAQPSLKQFESHDFHLDLHFILSGEETVEFASRKALDVACDYNEDNDYTLYNGKGNLITLSAGDFWIPMPDDAHKPNLTNGDTSIIKKAVFKIDLR